MEIDNSKYQENELLEIARKKVKKLKGFYTHAFIYAIGVIFFILKEYCGVPFNFFPIQHINFFVMAIWSTAFFISAVDILIVHHFFGKEWEEDKIKRIMKKESNKQIWK
nr:2TM domain-containing protein [uncultured Flavobacterium sp.]